MGSHLGSAAKKQIFKRDIFGIGAEKIKTNKWIFFKILKVKCTCEEFLRTCAVVDFAFGRFLGRRNFREKLGLFSKNKCYYKNLMYYNISRKII